VAAFYTIGHGTRTGEEFAGILRGLRVAQLVDVRAHPGSRHNPQFSVQSLRDSLGACDVEYVWDERLGGRRRPYVDSLNPGLRNAAFRAYADHMGTVEFAAALDELLARAERSAIAIMCAETLWWRCHRRLIADAAELTRGATVSHVLPNGSLVRHRATEGATTVGGITVYP
jgi:uncharacterized protein (DUF488 family)